jgi:hypothetical protein
MRFAQSLYRLKQKYNLPGATSYDIKGEAIGPSFLDRKMRLKLPRLAEMGQVLERHVAAEFRRIRQERLKTASITVNEPGIEFTVGYDANLRYGSGHYPSFTAAYSLTRNPVYTALKAKVRQLKKSGAADPFGIFICDGGCALLNSSRSYTEVVDIDQVIGEFFRQNSSASFVAILMFPPTRAEVFVGPVEEVRITGRVYANPTDAKPFDADALLGILNRGLAHLPPPAATPRVALNWIQNAGPHEGKPIGTIAYGVGLMSASVRISARKVQELLAGKITVDQLFSEYKHPDPEIGNPFLNALKRGLTMEAVTLTRAPDADDDLLEVKFGLPDPAIRRLIAD